MFFLQEYERAKALNESADPAPDVICGTCGRSMPQGKEARRHKRNCGRFTSEICHKVFASKRALERHGKSHTNIYNCERCEKALSSKQALDRHIRGCL